MTGAGHRGEAKRHFYFTVDGIPEEVLIETLGQVVLDGGTEGAVKDSIAGTVKKRVAMRSVPMRRWLRSRATVEKHQDRQK